MSLDEGGRVTASVAHELTTKIYRQAGALRFAQYEAKKLPKNECVLVVLHPTGRSVGVLASGTGGRVPPNAALRAKNMVRQLLPNLVPARRRTSRRPRHHAPTKNKRRTSRVSRGRR